MATDPSQSDPQARRNVPSAEDVLEGATYQARSPEEIIERYPAKHRETDPGQALGLLSLGLGLVALLAPRPLGRLIGLGEHAGLLRLAGARELASGAGLLTQQERAPWLWSRVAGDAMDLTLLATGLRPTNPGRGRAMGAIAAVAAIAALDVAASLRETSRQHEPSRATARGSSRASEHLVEHTVSVNKSAQECYAFWRDVSNLQKFSRMLGSVTKIDDRRSHWVLRGPGGASVGWNSEITVDQPGERLAWHSVQGSEVQHAGVVRFERAPGGRGTFVSVMMHYQPPGGRIATGLAKVLGKDPNHQMREDLRRFKSAIETGEVPSTRGQSSGRRSFLGRMTRDGRESRQGAVS
jgi:uncharacterized membrane protein